MTQSAILDALQSALAHHQAGRWSEAEALYRQVLAADANHVDALHLMGALAQQRGHYQMSLDLLQRAVAINPSIANHHNTLGETQRLMGQMPEAIVAFQNALQREPALFEALDNMGLALQSLGRVADAEMAFRKCAQLNPRFAAAHGHLGVLLSGQNRHEEALEALRRAMDLNPAGAQAVYNFGMGLDAANRAAEAFMAYQRAHQLNPDFPENLHNIAFHFMKLGRIAEAKAACARAIALRPDYAEAHLALGFIHLLEGNFAEGWAEHEWRWKCRGLPPSRDLGRPQWDGSDLHGQTIFLHCEQGFGDTIHFIRFVPLVAARGGTVVVLCPPVLVELVRSVPEISRVIPTSDPFPPFDVHLPLLSLPHVLHTRSDTIPRKVPYLSVSAKRLEKFRTLADEQERSKSGGDDSSPRQRPLRVGLVWQGRTTYKDDKNRSISLALLDPLAALPDVIFYSLQKGPASAQANSPSSPLRLMDLTEKLHDFADTAALILQLDLVIGSDTSVMHLAGALACPVWMLLSFGSEWRWQLHRADSPWYPTMRLFRQQKPGDWPGVVAEIFAALQAFIATRASH